MNSNREHRSTAAYGSPDLKSLRGEAHHLKDCYTRFAFQSLAMAAAANAIVARYVWEIPEIGLVCIFPILLLLATARIGTFKYGSANRLLGYELHLSRVRRLPDELGNGWKKEMAEIGWEEALRAWRIVQATVYQKLYETDRVMPELLKHEHLGKDYRWFEPAAMVVAGTDYYAGSYLQKTIHMLYLMALCSFILLLVMAGSFLWHREMVALVAAGVLTALMWVVIDARVARVDARRKNIERGLLSIHSCAIMWQAVVVAHFRALHMLNASDKDAGFRDYTMVVSLQAKHLASHIFQIHEWVKDCPQQELYGEMMEHRLHRKGGDPGEHQRTGLWNVLVRELKPGLWPGGQFVLRTFLVRMILPRPPPPSAPPAHGPSLPQLLRLNGVSPLALMLGGGFIGIVLVVALIRASADNLFMKVDVAYVSVGSAVGVYATALLYLGARSNHRRPILAVGLYICSAILLIELVLIAVSLIRDYVT